MILRVISNFFRETSFWLRALITALISFVFGSGVRSPDLSFLVLVVFFIALGSLVWTGIGAFKRSEPAVVGTRPTGRRGGRIALLFTVVPIVLMIALGFGNATSLALNPYSAQEIADRADAELSKAQEIDAVNAAEAAEEAAAAEKTAAEEAAAAEKAAADKSAEDAALAEANAWRAMGSDMEWRKGEFTNCRNSSVDCYQFELRVLKDCSRGVYFLANTKDSTGRVIGETAATYGDLRSGDVALIEMPLDSKDVKSLSFGTYSCYN